MPDKGKERLATARNQNGMADGETTGKKMRSRRVAAASNWNGRDRLGRFDQQGHDQNTCRG
jgi:hypothetical protein